MAINQSGVHTYPSIISVLDLHGARKKRQTGGPRSRSPMNPGSVYVVILNIGWCRENVESVASNRMSMNTTVLAKTSHCEWIS